MTRKAKGIVSLFLMLGISFTMLIPAYAANNSIKADTKTGVKAEVQAEALKQLGLFKSASGIDFDLKKAPTRTDALVMMLRLLGKESEALSGTWTHPFTDVAAGADKYIGYAYEKGLTGGVSKTKFGTGSVSSAAYLTFMLRVLGYDDAKGDFSWKKPDILAAAVGILPGGVDTKKFLNSDMAIVTWETVKADMKGGRVTLAKKLMAEEIIGKDDFSAAFELNKEQELKTVPVSTEKELQAALKDSAVKAVEINSKGTPVLVSGKLEIPRGVTVTVNRGSDFYIEGTLTNNGTILVLGADSISNDSVNYAVMCVQKGGKVINKGALRLYAAKLGDDEDRGPVGGQLRIFDGSFSNPGSVFLQAGRVNTHGGMAVVEGGRFENTAVVVMDGFFLRIDKKGAFINNAGGVIINNSVILNEGDGSFTNKGILSGEAVTGE